MSSATVPGAVSGHSDPQNDLHVELRHIRDLISIRDLLRERGAASTELGEYDGRLSGRRPRSGRRQATSQSPEVR